MKKIHRMRETHAKKFYVCEKCEADIIPGDLCYSYKPLPKFTNGKWRAQRWRRRCMSCPPQTYEEADYFVSETERYYNHMRR